MNDVDRQLLRNFTIVAIVVAVGIGLASFLIIRHVI